MLSFGKIIDVEEIVNISNACFGNDYIDKQQIKRSINSSELVTIKVNDSLIGFCIFTTPRIDNKQTFCFIESIAITPDYHQKGYGTKLLNWTLHNIQKIGYPSVNYKAWIEAPNIYFLSKIEQIGFIKLKVIKDYWKQDSINKPFNCKICGSPPCNCSVAIYQLSF